MIHLLLRMLLSAVHGKEMLEMEMIENSCFKPVGIILENIIMSLFY